MIAIYKTDVDNENSANYIIAIIFNQFPGLKVNFDLDDCDKILRVEGPSVCDNAITALLKPLGINVEVLE